MDIDFEVEKIMGERIKLLALKYSHGLSEDETSRLSWLNDEAGRLCPRVTPEMKAEMERMKKMIGDLDAVLVSL